MHIVRECHSHFARVVMFPNPTDPEYLQSGAIAGKLNSGQPGGAQTPLAARPSTLSRHIGCRAETAGTFNTSFRVKKSGILTKFASEKINETRGPVCESNTGGFLIFLVEICDISPTVAGQWCFVLTKSYLAAAVHERK